jgi:hypothetical protein
MKICGTCKTDKPLDEFYFSKGKPSSRCRACTRAKASESHERNREHRRDYRHRYYEENKDKIRDKIREWNDQNKEFIKQRRKKRYQENKAEYRSKWLMKNYGIKAADYDRMLLEQGGLCKICKSSDHKSKRVEHFAVDHDHETGQVRGLLCHSCNRGIGYLQDRLEIVEAAAKYLKGEG